MRLVSTISISIALFGTVMYPPETQAGKNVAVIFACGNADGTAHSRSESTIEADGENLSRVLAGAGYEVHLFSNREAILTGLDQHRPRYQNVRTAIAQLAYDPEIDPDSRVVVAVLGQMYALRKLDAKTRPVRIAEDGTRLPPKLFLQCSDTRSFNFLNPAPSNDAVEPKHKLLSLEWVWEQLAQSRAASKFAILDVCRYEVMTTGRVALGLQANLPQLSELPAGVALLSACSKGERSLDEWCYLGAGVFMHHLLCGLQRNADGAGGGRKDQAVSVAELAAYVQSHVSEHVKLRYTKMVTYDRQKNNTQHPQLLGATADAALLKVNRKMTGRKAGTVRAFRVGDVSFRAAWCPPGKSVIDVARDPSKPPIETILSLGFWMGQTEVTQDVGNA